MESISNEENQFTFAQRKAEKADCLAQCQLTFTVGTDSSEFALDLERYEGSARHPIELFVAARAGFALIEQGGIVARDQLQGWIRSSNRAGAYNLSIALSRHLKMIERTPKLPAALGSTLDLAKAHRNLGQYDDALSSYRCCLISARPQDDSLEIARALLHVGKLAGNYLGQNGLHAAFVDEARRRLIGPLKRNPENERIARYSAMCYDALGQAYRNLESGQAERHFARAVQINRRYGIKNGLSRSQCHMAYFKFEGCLDSTRKRQYLHDFERAFERVLSDPFEEPGCAVRWLQHAFMLWTFGSNDAEESLQRAERLAQFYAAGKVATRIALFRYHFHAAADRTVAIKFLQHGLYLSQEYGLKVQEVNFNKLLSTALSGNGTSVPTTEIIARNSELLVDLAAQSKLSMSYLKGATDRPPEYNYLSVHAKRTFHEHIVVDLARAVTELNSVSEMLTLVRAAERRRDETLVLAAVNSVARELLHEVKLGLQDAESPLSTISSEISSAALRSQSVDASHQMEKWALRLSTFDKRLQRLRSLLVDRLMRPRNLNAWCTISSVADEAIRELGASRKATPGPMLATRLPFDLEINLDQVFLVMVILNLFRNAMQAHERDEYSTGEIFIEVFVRPPAQSRNDRPSVCTPVLRIGSLLSCEREANRMKCEIEDGLGGRSNHVGGTGVGLDLALLAFRDILGSSVEAYADRCEAGIQIPLKMSTRRIRVVPFPKGARR